MPLIFLSSLSSLKYSPGPGLLTRDVRVHTSSYYQYDREILVLPCTVLYRYVECDPALFSNTSHQMEYTRILYYAYTMYMPKIYIVYPKNILYIYTKYIQCTYNEYTIYILGICNVYTKDNHLVYTMNILGMYGIYQGKYGIYHLC